MENYDCHLNLSQVRWGKGCLSVKSGEFQGNDSQLENFRQAIPALRQSHEQSGSRNRHLASVKSLFLHAHKRTVTLVFSETDAWPRRCSKGLAGTIAREELCLCEESEYLQQSLRCWRGRVLWRRGP